jgi:hypothetical protein
MHDGGTPAKSPGYAGAMYNYARAMYSMREGTGALDFAAWCKQNRSGLVGGLNGAYFDLARELGATVAPVGMAWKKAIAADPGRVLHQADKNHPNATGSYLAACVFYGTLLRRNPVGPPGKLTKEGKMLVEISPDESRRLQEIAWQTVQETQHRHTTGK